MQRSLIQAVAPTDFTTVRDPQRSALERKACMPPAPTAIGTDDGYLVPNPEFFENTDGPNASPASTARLSLSRPSPQEIPTCGPRSDGASTLGWAREISELDSTPYAELGLDNTALPDEALIDAMMEHPILINRPLVVSPLGVKLCRPSEAVLDLLPTGQLGAFAKEDGEQVVDASGRRIV